MNRPPLQISPVAAGIIRLARRLMAEPRSGEGIPELHLEGAAPHGLTAQAWELVAESCAQGSVRSVLRAGGAFTQTRWLKDAPVSGLLWEMFPPETLGLTFTEHTADLLLHVGVAPERALETPLRATSSVSLGDRWFAAQALRHLQGTPAANWVWRHLPFRDDGLLWLLFPEEIARLRGDVAAIEPDFSAWSTPVGQAWGSSLLHRVRECWCRRLRDQCSRGPGPDWSAGQTVLQRAAQGWLKECARVESRELCVWLVPVLQQVIELQGTAARDDLFDHAATVQAAQWMVLELVEELERWTRRAQLTGYLDEGYPAAQFWLKVWETARGSDWIATARSIAGRQTVSLTR